MIKIFNKSKKILFLAHFSTHWPNFYGKKSFAKKILVIHISISTSYGFLALFPYFEKTNDSIPKKTPIRTKGQKDGWKERRMDRLYFIGPFWQPPGVKK